MMEWMGSSAVEPRGAEHHRFVHEPVLGTMVTLNLVGSLHADGAEQVDTAMMAEFDRLEQIFSVYRSDSEMQCWKRGAIAPHATSPEFRTAMAAALDWQRRSDGRFNTSTSTITDLWWAAVERGTPPSSEERRTAVAAIAEPTFEIDAEGAPVPTGEVSGVNLNAFVKGWIVDRALTATVAAAAQVCEHPTDVLISAGGDLRHAGPHRQRVKVENPLRPYDNEPPLCTISIRDQAVATSGRARRGFNIDGRWYAHVIDPRTGHPVDRIASISVIAHDAANADVLATVLGVLPPHEAIAAASDDGVACLVIASGGERFTNPVWDRHVIEGSSR